MTDIIRKAVEYAEGWGLSVLKKNGPPEIFYYKNQNGYWHLDHPPQAAKDALAAQLVRQIDAMNYEIISSEGHCAVYDQEHQVNTLEVNSSYDRTDNTLNACVEFYDNE